MTKEEVIKYLEKRKEKALMLMEKSKADTPINNEVRGILTRKIEALDMAISALSEELSEDGTLTVHVSDGSKVNRVFVMGDNIFGGLYYPDSAENMGEWIPIEERKPAEDGEYLLWGKISEDEESDYQFIGNYDTCGEEFGDWEDYYDSSTLGFLDSELHKYYEVLAWQPLPEPYKKGESK